MPETTGRSVVVNGTTIRVCWAVTTLQRHYEDHALGKRDPRERACWADVLGSPPPVSQAAYEAASYDTIDRASLHFRFREDPDLDSVDRFVDDRLLVCVTPDHRGRSELRIRTCFHQHFGGPYNHVVGEHGRGTAEQRLRRYRGWLETLADANRWEIKFYREDFSS